MSRYTQVIAVVAQQMENDFAEFAFDGPSNTPSNPRTATTLWDVFNWEVAFWRATVVVLCSLLCWLVLTVIAVRRVDRNLGLPFLTSDVSIRYKCSQDDLDALMRK